MAQITIIAPDTIEVVQTRMDLSAYKSGIVSAILVGAEEVLLYKLVGPTWAVLVDLTGTQKKLTATIEMMELAGGSCYAATKSVTAAPIGVYCDLGPGLNS